MRAACLALCMPCWPQAGPAHPCQPPHGRAQPFCLSWAELGTLTEVPQACYQMIYPRTRTHCPPPWTLQGPSSSPGIPSSAKGAGVEVWTAGEPHSAPRTGGPSSAMPAQNQCRGAPGRAGQGPGCSNPRQHRLCPASCSWADGLDPSLARRRSALWMGQCWVQPALSLARGGGHYRVRIATG